MKRTPSTTGTIPAEKHAALCDIINRIRKVQGWSAVTAKDLDPQIRVWVDQFDRHQVPIAAYRELLDRAVDFRARRYAEGKEPPTIDVSLLLSQWIGQNGLQAEWRQRQVESRRILPAHCEQCYGTGWKQVEQEDGYTGVARCLH